MKIHTKLLSGLALFVLLGLAAMPATAQDDLLEGEESVVPVLTLEDCLNLGVENNIGLQRARLGIETSILSRIRSEAVFDPGFTLDLSTRRSETPSSDTSSSTGSQIDFSGTYTLPTWIGSGWVFSFDQGRSHGSTGAGETSTSVSRYSSQVGVAYRMPILEGYGERVNRVGVEKADIGVRRSEASVRDAERTLRLTIVNAYIAAVLAAKQIEVAEKSLTTAENLVEETQARIDVGQLAPYELLAAQAGLAERQVALINAQTSLQTALDSLKDIIGIPITDEVMVDTGVLRPVYLETDADEMFILAQENRPDLLDIDLRMQQAQLDLLLADDKRQASLSWNTTLGLSGQDDNYGGSVGDMNHFSWSTGLEYTMPLGGNRAAEVDYSSAQFAIEQIELERIDYLRGLQTDIRSAVETFQNAVRRIDVTAQGLRVQEVKMESEQARHELGLITARDLLDFDVDLANARLAHDTALADALNALAKLESLIGQTLIEDALVLGDASANSADMGEDSQ
jgi:outer membrane protein